MDDIFEIEFVEVKSNQYFSLGKHYKAKRIFPNHWPWMVMAWGNDGIGRYIHGDYFGAWIGL